MAKTHKINAKKKPGRPPQNDPLRKKRVTTHRHPGWMCDWLLWKAGRENAVKAEIFEDALRVVYRESMMEYLDFIGEDPAEFGLNCGEQASDGCHSLAESGSPTQPHVSKTCCWSQEGEEEDVWSTDCGEYFTINDGTPEENNMRFCFYCGMPLKPILWEDR